MLIWLGVVVVIILLLVGTAVLTIQIQKFFMHRERIRHEEYYKKFGTCLTCSVYKYISGYDTTGHECWKDGDPKDEAV